MKKENIVSHNLAELQSFWDKNRNSLPLAHSLSDAEVEKLASRDDESVEIYASFFLKPNEAKILRKDNSQSLYGHFRTAIENYIHSRPQN